MPDTPYTDTNWGRFVQGYPRIENAMYAVAGICQLAADIASEDHDRWASGYVDTLIRLAKTMANASVQLLLDLVPEGERDIRF